MRVEKQGAKKKPLCSACGYQAFESDRHCLKCGAQVGGSANENPSYLKKGKSSHESMKGLSRFVWSWVVFLLLLCAGGVFLFLFWHDISRVFH